MKHISSSAIYWYLVGVLLNQSSAYSMDIHNNTLAALHSPFIELIFENIGTKKDQIAFALTCKTYLAISNTRKDQKDFEKQKRWISDPNPWEQKMNNDLHMFAIRNIRQMEKLANLSTLELKIIVRPIIYMDPSSHQLY